MVLCDLKPLTWIGNIMNKLAVIAILLQGLTNASFAADDKPEVFKFAEKSTSLDFVNQQVSAQKLNALKAISTPEMINAQADYYQKMYQALIKSGFDQEQALKIVVAMASSDK